MAHEPLLDLERVHVLAARDDHVVDAADEIEVAVGVELPEIAREVPAVPDLPRIGVGPLPVAREGLVAGERAGDLPDLARRDDRVGRRAGSTGSTRRMRAFSAGRPAQPGLARWSPWIVNV